MQNTLYFGDNLSIIKGIISKRREEDLPIQFIDLIYIDSPFNSKRQYNIYLEAEGDKKKQAQKQVFSDTWGIGYQEYIDEIKEQNYQDLAEVLLSLVKSKAIPVPHITCLSYMSLRIIYMYKLLKKTCSFYLHCDPTMSHYLKIILDIIYLELLIIKMR